MIRVVDASIAVRWFAPGRDASDDVAARVLFGVGARPREYAVPELFYYEVLTVLCRKLDDANAVTPLM